MNVDEIKQKYCVDKKQTGQVSVSPYSGKAVNFGKSNPESVAAKKAAYRRTIPEQQRKMGEEMDKAEMKQLNDFISDVINKAGKMSDSFFAEKRYQSLRLALSKLSHDAFLVRKAIDVAKKTAQNLKG